MKLILPIILLILLIFTVPVKAASTLTTAGTSTQSCRDFSVIAQATVISAGDIVYCLNMDGPVPSSNGKLQVSTIIMTPALGTGASVTFTPTVKDSSCTFGTATTAGTALTAAFGTQSSSTWTVTMTSDNCHGYIEGLVKATTTVTAFDDLFAFDIEAAQPPFFYACAATGVVPTSYDSTATTCNTPAYTATNTDSVKITQWPSLQTNTQSKEAGLVQLEANGPTILAPQSGSVNIPLLLNAYAPASVAATATALSIAPLIDGIAGGNGICTVSDTIAATTVTMSDGSAQYQYRRAVTFDADYCHLSGTVTLSTTGAPAAAVRMSWIFYRNTDKLSGTLDNTNRLCDASALGAPCTTPQIQTDSLMRLCAASAYNSTCTTPTINAAITGSLTTTLSGTLDVLDRLCSASAIGTSCTTATLNSIVSGTLDNLNRICDDSTLGSACNELHLTADLLTRLCAAGNYNTTCTAPNINAVLSGTLNTIQSGTLTIHQDPICTAAAHCHIDTNSTTVTIGNTTVNIPDHQILCGPGSTAPFNATTCKPLQSTSTVNLFTIPGFFELFGPLIAAVAFVAFLGVVGIWIAPGGVALGMAIFLHAFKQPYPFLVLLQAIAGISLAIFCLIALGIRVLKRKPKEPRRFFE